MTALVSLNVSGLTPSAVGPGLDFDVNLVPVQPSSPIRLDGDISGWVDIDVAALLEDEEGTFEIIPVVFLNIAGLTPEAVGTGLAFDIEKTAVQPRNPIQLVGEIEGQVDIDAAALAGDETGTMEIIPVSEMTVSGLTPSAVGPGHDFDVVRQTDGYRTAADRAEADPSKRLITSSWEPGKDAPPYDVPITRPGESEEAGVIPMLAEPVLDTDMLFTVIAAGTIEGSDDETITIRASVQPVKAQEADQVASITQGRQAYYLFTSTRLNTASEATRADYVTIDGKDYEVMAVEAWQNTALAHYKILVVSNVPLVSGGER